MTPPGEDLDAVVAKALGDDLWSRTVPHFSTTSVGIGAMIFWLNEKHWRVVLTQRVTGLWDATACAIAEDGERLYASDEEVEDCQTIQHAIANLVVAVAKAREAQ